MIKRRFKRSVIDEGRYIMYEPTVYKRGSVLVSDNYARKKRESRGSFDANFLVRVRKRRR